MVAAGARKAGLRIVCAGLAGQVEPELSGEVDEFREVGLARPGAWIRFLRRHGVNETIMVGRVSKRKMYTRWRIWHYRPDWRAFRLWYGRLRKLDKRNDSLLAALADELATGGIVLVDSTRYCKEEMAAEGVMTRRAPSEAVLKDIEFGWQIVKEMGRLDIGQAIAVKEQEVIAVEAIEGTDEMVERAGKLCKSGGWTLIKVAKPRQDMRFDVPTIGVGTIENLHRNGSGCLAVEAGVTFMVDKEELLALADKYKIAVVGLKKQ